MKKSLFFVLILQILFFVSFAGAPNAVALSTLSLKESENPEVIESLDFNAALNKDGTVSVVETIVYNFGEEMKHGIYRTIPLGFIAEGQPDHTTIKVLSVTDESGKDYTFTITSSDPLNIKIGDADTLIEGTHIYKISYTISKSIGYYDSYDEFYWNVTGDAWEVPIYRVTASVVFPNNIDIKNIKAFDYCGEKGSTESCGDFVMAENIVDYKTSNFAYINPGEQVTIAVGFPKGLVAVPTAGDFFFAKFLKVWFIPLPFIIAYIWFRKKIKYVLKHKKYFRENPVIPEYDANNFSPLEAGLVVNGNIDKKDLSSIVVHLATTGYLKIEDKDGEFCFTAIKDASLDMNESEKSVLSALTNKCESSLGVTEAEHFYKALNSAGTRLVARDYALNAKFKTTSNTMMFRFFLPLFLALNPGVFIWFIGRWAGVAFSGACVLIAIINLFFKTRSITLTEKGFEAERYLLGLREYIKVAEQDRIKFHNAPAKTPELFEKLLPYAMIFGLEDKWAKEFEGLYVGNPSWYQSTSNLNRFSTIAFISSLHSVQSSAESAIASSVRSSGSSWRASSGGGSSGGGSSGGGGGGGGGGSW